MYTLATLHDLRQHLNLAEEDTGSDDRLLRCLQDASQIIESLTGRRYCPMVESRSASFQPGTPDELMLPADLLALTSLHNGDGSPIRLLDVRRVPSHPDVSASVLHLVNGARFVYRGTPVGAIRVEGIWGWHDGWSRAWRDSLDSIQVGHLSASATTLSVTDSDGRNSAGLRPRFQVGHLLRLDMEYLRVTAIDRERNQLTVLRGVQGTRAAAHPAGRRIEIYEAAAAIRDVCLRYAALLVRSADVLEGESMTLLERLRRLSA